MRIYVPSMMPVLLETLRISMIFNFTGVMIAEMYASRTGIGHLIASWGENFQMPAAVLPAWSCWRRWPSLQRGRAPARGRVCEVAHMTAIEVDRLEPHL